MKYFCIRFILFSPYFRANWLLEFELRRKFVYVWPGSTFLTFTDHTLHKGPQSVNPVNELKDIVRKQLNLKEKIVWLILAFIWPELRRVISLAIVILLLEILRENFDKGRRCELDKNGMKVFKSVCWPDRQKEEKLMKQEWRNWILILTLKYFVIRILWANGKLNGLRESLEGLDTYNSL